MDLLFSEVIFKIILMFALKILSMYENVSFENNEFI